MKNKLTTESGIFSCYAKHKRGTLRKLKEKWTEVHHISLLPTGRNRNFAIVREHDELYPSQFRAQLFNSKGKRVSGKVKFIVTGNVRPDLTIGPKPEPEATKNPLSFFYDILADFKKLLDDKDESKRVAALYDDLDTKYALLQIEHRNLQTLYRSLSIKSKRRLTTRRKHK